jgi:hypothetical protein
MAPDLAPKDDEERAAVQRAFAKRSARSARGCPRGVTLPAMAVGHLALEGAIVGAEPTGAAAEILLQWTSKLGESPTREALEAHIDEALAGGRVRGFGVAFRGHDERVTATGRS